VGIDFYMLIKLEIEPQVSRVQFKQRIYTQNDSRREFEWHFRQIGRHIKFLKFSSAATRLQRRRPKSRPRLSTSLVPYSRIVLLDIEGGA